MPIISTCCARDRNSMERDNVFVENFARIQMDGGFGPRCRAKLATLNILLGSRANTTGESCFHERKKGCETELPAVAARRNWGHLDREKFTLFPNLTSVSDNIKSGEKYSRVNLESINARFGVFSIFARENSLFIMEIYS